MGHHHHHHHLSSAAPLEICGQWNRGRREEFAVLAHVQHWKIAEKRDKRWGRIHKMSQWFARVRDMGRLLTEGNRETLPVKSHYPRYQGQIVLWKSICFLDSCCTVCVGDLLRCGLLPRRPWFTRGHLTLPDLRQSLHAYKIHPCNVYPLLFWGFAASSASLINHCYLLQHAHIDAAVLLLLLQKNQASPSLLPRMHLPFSAHAKRLYAIHAGRVHCHDNGPQWKRRFN